MTLLTYKLFNNTTSGLLGVDYLYYYESLKIILYVHCTLVS